MPMNRKLYPENWEQIALAVKEKANWQCEWCDRPCRKSGESWKDFLARLPKSSCCRWFDDLNEAPGRFILTTAHLDHDPENPNARLAALCSGCHCRYDLKQMGRKRQLKNERNGQLRLF